MAPNMKPKTIELRFLNCKCPVSYRCRDCKKVASLLLSFSNESITLSHSLAHFSQPDFPHSIFREGVFGNPPRRITLHLIGVAHHL